MQIILRLVFLFVIGLFFLFPASAQFGNRPVPSDGPIYEVETNNFPLDGYFMTAPFKSGALPLADPSLYLLDQNGFLSWYEALPGYLGFDFKYHANLDQFSYILIESATQNIKGYVLNNQMQRIDSIEMLPPYRTDFHEFHLLDNGHYLIAGFLDTLMDLSMYTFDGEAGSDQTLVVSDVIHEYDQNHQLVFEWRGIDHIGFDEYYDFYNYNDQYFDYSHINAIKAAADGSGDLLVSFRNLNSIFRINRQSGEIVWRFGGKLNDFSFLNDAGFSAQHDIQDYGQGILSLFDNGNMANPQKSRGVIYQLDFNNMEANLLSVAEPINPIFASGMGNFQPLPALQYLLSWGQNYAPASMFSVIDDSGQFTFNTVFDFPFLTYRTAFTESSSSLLADGSPTITCETMANGSFLLSAQAGWENIEWSTEETSSSIEVSTNGYYQYWVDYGRGKIGSEVIELTDDGIENCLLTSISIPEPEPKTVQGYFNLLGQELQNPPALETFIIRYTDGTAEIRYHIPR